MKEHATLRHYQRKKVMPLIGPLLDAWDALPNDIRTDEEMDHFREIIGMIDNAMEGI